MPPIDIAAAAAAAEEAASKLATKASAPRTSTQPTALTYANFNQDALCVCVALASGYRIFHCQPFGQFLAHAEALVGMCEMLFNTLLVALVGSGASPALLPRRLRVVNTKRQLTIVEVSFPSTILAVRMNRSRMVVLVEEQIFVYDIKTMRMMHLVETPSNPAGVVALSSGETNLLAYPQPPRNSSDETRNGDVVVFDAESLAPVSVIEAHKTAVAAMTFSSDGKLLATASDKGTIVRVFSVELGVKLYQFRRGTYHAKIHGLSFSQDGRWLVVASATDTVHVFRLGESERWGRKKVGVRTKRVDEEDGSHLSPQTSPALDEVSLDIELIDDSDLDDEYEAPERVRRPLQTSVHSEESKPLVDLLRRLLSRLIRRQSQTLGRKAAERMGVYLPAKFALLLEPTRHFALLKVPLAKDSKAIAAIASEPSEDYVSLAYLEGGEEAKRPEDVAVSMLHISVVTLDGWFYTYGLDPERGGDCIMLEKHSMVEAEEPAAAT